MKECFGQYGEKDPICKQCLDVERCKVATDPAHRSLIGKIYPSPGCRDYQVDVKHPFHDTPETFEVYACPQCTGHFAVEAEALESLDEISCPYCQTLFKKEEPET